MAPRSYGQACPVAYVLDLMGERWTLLIVRDLLLGPLRFVDLLDRLPGIGRNLLAQRLKRLQQEGILNHRKLDPPAASQVYELTDKGQGLESGIMAFGSWGARYGSADIPRDGHLEPDLMAFAFKLMFDRQRADAVVQVLEVETEGKSFHLRVKEGQLEARRGRAEAFSVALEATPASLGRMLQSRTLALGDPTMRVQGKPSDIRDALRPFGVDVC